MQIFPSDLKRFFQYPNPYLFHLEATLKGFLSPFTGGVPQSGHCLRTNKKAIPITSQQNTTNEIFRNRQLAEYKKIMYGYLQKNRCPWLMWLWPNEQYKRPAPTRYRYSGVHVFGNPRQAKRLQRKIICANGNEKESRTISHRREILPPTPQAIDSTNLIKSNQCWQKRPSYTVTDR